MPMTMIHLNPASLLMRWSKTWGREIRGIVAIRQWADQEIFAVNVPLDVMDVDKRDGQTIIP